MSGEPRDHECAAGCGRPNPGHVLRERNVDRYYHEACLPKAWFLAAPGAELTGRTPDDAQTTGRTPDLFELR